MAGVALSQGQVFLRVELLGRRITLARSGADPGATFERSGADYAAGAALSQGHVQISWQVQHFHKVKYRFRGRGSTFARSRADLKAGAALWQGQVQVSWQHFRKVK